MNYTKMNQTDPFIPSFDVMTEQGKGTNEYDVYLQLIRENIEYDCLLADFKSSRAELDELVDLIAEVVSIERDTIRINGSDYPYQIVRNRFLKLDYSHIRFVLECLAANTTKITNMRAYLLTTLFNAPNVMNNHYRSEVSHDMYGGGWMDKGVICGERKS